jgi:hypothetical protein
MKNVQDKTRRDVECALNDWVWVRLLQRTTVGITTTSHSKLGPKFYGSFKVLQRIGSMSYKLELPPKQGFMMYFMSPSSRISKVLLLHLWSLCQPYITVVCFLLRRRCSRRGRTAVFGKFSSNGRVVSQQIPLRNSLKISISASQQYNSRMSCLLGRGVMLSTHLWASNVSGAEWRKEIFTKVARIC